MPKPEHVARTTWPPCCCSSSQDNTWAQRGWDRGGSGQGGLTGGLTGGLLSALMCITALLLTTNRFVLWGSKKTVISDSDNSSSAAERKSVAPAGSACAAGSRVIFKIAGWCYVLLEAHGARKWPRPFYSHVTLKHLLFIGVSDVTTFWPSVSLCGAGGVHDCLCSLSMCLCHFMGSEKQQITDSGAH